VMYKPLWTIDNFEVTIGSAVALFMVIWLVFYAAGRLKKIS
jgi:hypothetical protein